MDKQYDSKTKTVDTGQVLLNDAHCERLVLGSIIANSAALDEARELLNPECFHNPFHRDVYKAVSAIDNRGDSPDMVAVMAELARMGIQADYLALADIVTSTAVGSVREHSARLLDLSARRRFWEIGQQLIQGALTEVDEIETVQGRAMDALSDMLSLPDGSVTPISRTAAELLEHVARNMSDDAPPTGSRTGFRAMDRNGGLQPGDLVVVAGETSMGKSALAVTMTANIALSGDAVAYYSLEMTNRQLTARIVAGQSGVSSSDMLFRKVDDATFGRIASGVDRVSPMRVYFDDSSGSSLERITASIRSMKIKHGISGAVIDYLQILSLGSGRGMNREQAVAQAARDLKNLATKLGIWIIALSQLSRNRDCPQPTLNRLRDSGQIEEAADTIILIYRPEKFPRNPPFPEPFAQYSTEGLAYIDVAKGRNTGTTCFLAKFDGPTTKFTDVDLGCVPMRNEAVPATEVRDRDSDNPF